MQLNWSLYVWQSHYRGFKLSICKVFGNNQGFSRNFYSTSWCVKIQYLFQFSIFIVTQQKLLFILVPIVLELKRT